MPRDPAREPSQSWVTLLVLYSITSLVEGLGVSQIFAFMFLYLRGMGVGAGSVGHWVGGLSSLVFILGLPIVPLWGVWADKYSRKAVIVRSAVVEAVVFAAVALSRTPLELAGSLLLVGFQLGNTGVMLSALRDVTPARRLGIAIGIFVASSPVGFAVGPWVGALMIDHLHTSIAAVYWVAAALSAGVALMLMLGSREVRPDVVPEGPTLRLAYGAVRGVFSEPATLRLFATFGLALLGRQMMNPYLPLLVAHVHGPRPGVAGSVGLVVGVSALAGALVSPVAGTIGDRVGFRGVLVGSLAATAAAMALMPASPSVAALAALSIVAVAMFTSVNSMVAASLAVETPVERRSATLNLILLPLYLAGIVGPGIGALVVAVGLPAVFFTAGCLLALAVPVALLRGPGTTAARLGV